MGIWGIIIGISFICSGKYDFQYISKVGIFENNIYEDNEEANIYDETFSDIFENIDSVADSLWNDEGELDSISFSTIYSYIKSGDIDALLKYCGDYIRYAILGDMEKNKIYIFQLMAVIILGSLFSGLNSRYANITGNSVFFVTYMIIVWLLLGLFTLAQDIAVNTVSNISELVLAFIPAYSLAIGYSTGSSTAEFVYEMVIFVIFLCENIICNIVFPFVKCSGIIGIINKINPEDYFSKTVALIRNIVSWIIKTMFAVVTGLNIIKGMITPSIDRINRQAVVKIMTSLPGGTMAQTVSDILLSSGILIKNAIGMAGAVIILFVSMVPVVKIWCIYISLRLASACVQPIGDKRYSEAVNIMAQTIELILKSCGAAVIMFIISIMIMTILTR